MPDNTRRIYIVRHGETDYNRQQIVQGRGVDTSLNERGRAQADRFYQAYKHVPFDRVITSTLQRTHQSVAGFLQAGLPWQQFAELDEIDWGIHEGKASTPEMRQHYKEVVAQWRLGNLHHSINGGESAQALAERQTRFLQQLPSIPGSNLLIASHGRAIRSLICLMVGRDLREMDEIPHANLTLYVMRDLSGRYEVERFHDTDHLRGLDVS